MMRTAGRHDLTTNRMETLNISSASLCASQQRIPDLTTAVAELVSNALDARALSIVVKMRGMDITVDDDGLGVLSASFAMLAIGGATSRQLGRSEPINMLGLRGQALASIAALATLSITSRAGALET